MIPEGYEIVRYGWFREPIGYKEQSILDPNYNPIIKPEKTFSDPIRYIDIKLMDECLSHEIRIWDLDTPEFDEVFENCKTKIELFGIPDKFT